MSARADGEQVPLVVADGESLDDDDQRGSTLWSSMRKRKGVLITAAVGAISIVILAIILTMIFTGGIKLPQVTELSTVDKFLAAVDPQMLRAFMKEYSAKPHIAGSVNDHETAKRTKDLYESFGLRARIEEIPVMLTLPINRAVSVTFPPELIYNCSLTEPIVNDSTSGVPGAVDPWNAWSGSGTAEGELVFANYGRKEDFEAISHINLTGKIVIVKDGEIFRANKAAFAIARGAIALVMYIDPADVGYLKGPVYPTGPWATNYTAHRGTMWLGNGDPSTPGWPSTINGPRWSYSTAQNPPPNSPFPPLPKIPIQPMSADDAWHLLKGLAGEPIPKPDWAGGFNLTSVGPGPVRVRVTVQANYTVTPIWNVFGVVQGVVEPDKYVLIGSHRDAWTFGAGDPISGHSTILEVARVIGLLLAKGVTFRRSIIFASFDAEEYGLVGSTEWTERNIAALTANAVAYFNVDIAVTGNATLDCGGTPSLFKLVQAGAQAIQVPNPNAPGTQHTLWSTADDFGYPSDGSDDGGLALFAGIPTMDCRLNGPDSGEAYEAVYHSNYDSFYWYENFGDPDFLYHAGMAKLYGYLTIRMATEVLAPFDFEEYAVRINDEIDILVNATGLDVRLLRDGASRLHGSAQIAKNQARLYNGQDDLIEPINKRYCLFERFLLDSALSGRPYYKHILWTPSPEDSYAGTAFGAIYSAFYSNLTATAQLNADRIGFLIDSAALYLNPVDYLLGNSSA